MRSINLIGRYVIPRFKQPWSVVEDPEVLRARIGPVAPPPPDRQVPRPGGAVAVLPGATSPAQARPLSLASSIAIIFQTGAGLD